MIERERKERSKENISKMKQTRRRAITLQGALEKKSDIAIAIMEKLINGQHYNQYHPVFWRHQ